MKKKKKFLWISGGVPDRKRSTRKVVRNTDRYFHATWTIYEETEKSCIRCIFKADIRKFLNF